MDNPLQREEPVDRMKREAGCHAADIVEDGMVIGLGTGSTTLYAMEHLSVLIEENGLCIQAVPTSFQTEMRARQLQIPLTTLDAYPELDLAIDGADQVDPDLCLIKGRGAALTREKCVAAAAEELIIVVDASKCVRSLSGPVPLEVIPFALHPVILGVRAIGGVPELRNGIRKDGPVITDNGNFILDCLFGEITEPGRLEGILSLMPGVLSCGLFCGFVEKTRVVVGGEDGCRELKRQ
ncbi:MAG: ribose-5-phosphate isomerase RpiA [Methanoregulaceae archaeon]|nr:ribose-5-phosphate isomerase RpiA [Methanoregulaceae archaeon]